MLDYTHNLYNFGSWPNAPYSDMNGYGHFLPAAAVVPGRTGALFAAGAAVAGVGAVGARRRRRRRSSAGRWRGSACAAGSALALAVSRAGLRRRSADSCSGTPTSATTIVSPDGQLDLQARYERDYRKYKDLPQPRIAGGVRPTSTCIRKRSRCACTACTACTTRMPTPIADSTCRCTDDKALVAIDLGGAKLALHDEPLGYRIYRLDQPLQPGEERDIALRPRLPPDRHHATTPRSTQIVDNGTFFNSQMFPPFGYDERVQIMDRNERRKRGLGEPHAHAEARRPGRARQHLPHRRRRLDRLQDHRLHRAGPDRAGAGLPADGMRPQTAAATSATRWTGRCWTSSPTCRRAGK